jgi:hypothetical protein
MPTTRNSAALNSPWASTSAQPATSAAGVPSPSSTIISPSWLIVP